MGYGDRILATISHIHDAGLDPAKWPEALSQVTALIGGQGASLEFMKRPTFRHWQMYSYGLPDVSAYMEYYAPKSPRYPPLKSQPAGSVQYGALYYGKDVMDAHPFYTEFHAEFDMRYFFGGLRSRSRPTTSWPSPFRYHPNRGIPAQRRSRPWSCCCLTYSKRPMSCAVSVICRMRRRH